ncbi:MAG: DoxX family protein [Chlamydiales bacterium]|nr:DoxX family protein [Chlamydiales bacterium]
MRTFYEKLVIVGNALRSIFLLVVRVGWGLGFFYAGSGKLMHIDQFATFLTTLGFPAPVATAYFVASVEAVGGLMLLIGLGSRLVGLILTINMSVAYFTAHMEAIVGFWNNPRVFVEESAFLYLFVAVIVFVFGPGLFSIDELLQRYVFKNRREQLP